MTATPPPEATPAAAPAGPRAWQPWVLALLPPVLVLVLRSSLKMQADEATASLQALQLATLVSSPGEALWAATRPVLLAVGSVAAVLLCVWLGLRTAIRRLGWPRVRPFAKGLWLALWALVAAGLLAQHLNRSGRQPQPPFAATVLLAGEVRASAHGPGGAEVYLQPQDQSPPLRLHVPERPVTDFPTGSTHQVLPEAGRWWGRWARLGPAD